MIENITTLKSLVYKGAILKQLIMNDVVLDRLNHELFIIDKLKLIDYFLIYSKVVKICNAQNILRSYGRGSACASLVNYCLDITKLNPLQEGLFFERFLNPEISEYADIDIDIPFGYHKIIIEKLKEELPDHFIYKLAYLPTSSNVEYEKVIINEISYKEHPCAIIISSEKFPLSIGVYNNIEYYYTDHYLEISKTLNPFKFDILELDYLNKLEDVVKLVGDEFHPYKLLLTDKKVFDFFKNGDRSNIFQFSTNSIHKILSDFEPTSIYDLTIINSLFRPRSLDNIPTVTNNKRNGYIDPYQNDKRVGDILKDTYGVLIFQETLIHLLNEIAGFSFIEADKFRRILFEGNDKEKISEFSIKFKSGCTANSSLKSKDIKQLETMILEQIPRSFLKSHTLCYATIAYWGAYYKVNFEMEFDYVFNRKEDNLWF
jgi:DNA polymerase-3 subunit alpha